MDYTLARPLTPALSPKGRGRKKHSPFSKEVRRSKFNDLPLKTLSPLGERAG